MACAWTCQNKNNPVNRGLAGCLEQLLWRDSCRSKTSKKAPAQHVLLGRLHWDIQASLFLAFCSDFHHDFNVKNSGLHSTAFPGRFCIWPKTAGIRAMLLHRAGMFHTRQGKFGLFLPKSFARFFWPSFLLLSLSICLKHMIHISGKHSFMLKLGPAPLIKFH